MIRAVNLADAKAISEIYNYYVIHSIITFEEQPISSEEMDKRIGEISSSFPWLVYEQDDRVVGYAYATQWKMRSAYRYSAEATVYLAHDVAGRGIGSQLYAELFGRLRAQGYHCVMGGIALPNPASVALHEKFGFVKVAHLKEVGWKFDRWIDVGYWQLLLDQ